MSVADTNTVITTLTIAAGLALAIERTIELLKYIMGSANGTLGKAEIKDLIERAAQIVKDAREAVKGARSGTPVEATEFSLPVPPPAQEEVVRNAADSEASEQYPAPAIPVIPPTPLSVQQTGKQLFYVLTAVGLGIILAHIFEIRLLALLTVNNGVKLDDLSETHAVLFSFFDIILSGFVIGAGSQPIHVLIRFLTERAVTPPAEETAEAAPINAAVDPGTVIAGGNLVAEIKEPHPLQWKDIAYLGGINPASLQATHFRPANPNQIVYHHTAMSSGSPFQAVVDEFLVTKKWLTGYHCVIMPDGIIRPFCRWDRSGNHAAGHNAQSLGLSFHGNFHTEPGDQYSNADGRYGNQQPTEAQLHAGARVVALWIHLYAEMRLDFECCILAHKEIMPGHTVCPGSNFPYTGFKQLIRQYYQAWTESPEAQQNIAAFKQLEYIYI